MEYEDKILILGSSGCGKSTYLKKEIHKLSLNFKQQIFIFDINNEYNELSEKIAGKDIFLFPDSDNIINPFDLYVNFDFDYTYDINNKIDFIFRILEFLMNKELSAILKSKLDYKIHILYQPYLEYLKKYNINIDRTKCPTFKDFYELLNNSNDKDLQIIADIIYIFCNGFVKTFNGNTNINTNFSTVRYNLYKMGHHFLHLSLMICIEDMYIRMRENNKKNIYTYSFFDDADVIFNNEAMILHFYNIFRRSRKLRGKIIISIQSCSDIIKNNYGFHIISNMSKYIFFHQKDLDLDKLKIYFGLNEMQLEQIKNFNMGEFLIMSTTHPLK